MYTVLSDFSVFPNKLKAVVWKLWNEASQVTIKGYAYIESNSRFQYQWRSHAGARWGTLVHVP